MDSKKMIVDRKEIILRFFDFSDKKLFSKSRPLHPHVSLEDKKSTNVKNEATTGVSRENPKGVGFLF